MKKGLLLWRKVCFCTKESENRIDSTHILILPGAWAAPKEGQKVLQRLQAFAQIILSTVNEDLTLNSQISIFFATFSLNKNGNRFNVNQIYDRRTEQNRNFIGEKMKEKNSVLQDL